MKRQDEGFTLIELLIVIVILGILATVVVFAVSGIRDSGDQSACETEARAIQTALEAQYAADGTYVPTSAALGSYFNSDFQYFSTDALIADLNPTAANPDVVSLCSALT